jgi:hypothetical protein
MPAPKRAFSGAACCRTRSGLYARCRAFVMRSERDQSGPGYGLGWSLSDFAGNVCRFGPILQTGSKGNVMEDCFHQRAVKSSSRIKRRDNCARPGHERAKPCIAGPRRVELNAAVNPQGRMVASSLPAGDLIAAPSHAGRRQPQSQQRAKLLAASSEEGLWAFCCGGRN